MDFLTVDQKKSREGMHNEDVTLIFEKDQEFPKFARANHPRFPRILVENCTFPNRLTRSTCVEEFLL